MNLARHVVTVGRSFLCGRAGQFAPRDQFDVLLRQNLAELVAGEKIEVALPPGRSPGGTFAGRGTQFLVVVPGMDDKLRDAGFQIPERGQVKVRPLLRRDFRFNRDRVIQHNISRTETGRQVGIGSKPISGNEHWQLVVMGHA